MILVFLFWFGKCEPNLNYLQAVPQHTFQYLIEVQLLQQRALDFLHHKTEKVMQVNFHTNL